MGEVAERVRVSVGPAHYEGSRRPSRSTPMCPRAGSAIPARREDCRAYVNRVNALGSATGS